MNPTRVPAWKALEAHRRELEPSHMRSLFAADPGRFQKLSIELPGMLFDYSKHRITDHTLELLLHEPDVGLALVTSDLWTSLSERLQTTAERLGRPIVLPIPAGAVTDMATRRQVLGEMLQRAIGYRIDLGTSEGRS